MHIYFQKFAELEHPLLFINPSFFCKFFSICYYFFVLSTVITCILTFFLKTTRIQYSYTSLQWCNICIPFSKVLSVGLSFCWFGSLFWSIGVALSDRRAALFVVRLDTQSHLCISRFSSLLAPLCFALGFMPAPLTPPSWAHSFPLPIASGTRRDHLIELGPQLLLAWRKMLLNGNYLLPN